MDTLCEDLHTFLGTSRAYLDKHLLVRNLLRTKLVGENKTHILLWPAHPASHMAFKMMKLE